MAALAVGLSLSPHASRAQSSYHGQAAQAYLNAAAQCGNPSGAACMRRYAAYEGCMARDVSGGSCGMAPTCSTSCVQGGTTSAGAMPGGISISPGVPQGSSDAIGLALSLLNGSDSGRSDAPAPTGPDPTAAAQSEHRKIEAEAETLLEESAVPPAPSTADTPGNVLTGSPAPAQANSGSDAQGSTDTLPAFAGFSPAPDAPPASTAASDQDPGNNSSSPTETTPAAPPSVDEPSTEAIPDALRPSDPDMDTALQESADNPDPAQAAQLPEALQSPGANDGLNAVISPKPSLASDLTDDPVAQWIASGGDPSVLPVESAAAGRGESATGGDNSVEAAGNAVFTKSITGFRDLIKGMAGGPVAWSKALYNYGNDLVNKLGRELGLANDQIAQMNQDNPSPEQSP